VLCPSGARKGRERERERARWRASDDASKPRKLMRVSCSSSPLNSLLLLIHAPQVYLRVLTHLSYNSTSPPRSSFHPNPPHYDDRPPISRTTQAILATLSVSPSSSALPLEQRALTATSPRQLRSRRNGLVGGSVRSGNPVTTREGRAGRWDQADAALR
jgi:hypothetical protein